jgi:hypothetical protein
VARLDRRLQILRAVLLVLVAVVFAVLRVLGWKSEAYQAFAHLYLGCLIGGWYLTYDDRGWNGCDRGLLSLALILSAVELVCFLVGKS